MAQNKYEKTNHEMLKDIEGILSQWYPDGRVVNGRFHIGGVDGAEGNSMNVAIEGEKIGKWYDFATAQGGGDLISLYAHKEQIPMSKAHEALKEIYGPHDPIITKPPVTAEKPTKLLQNVDKYWTYCDESGDPLTYVARSSGKNGQKIFRQISYDSRTEDWIPKGWPDPKPLYNLDKLVADPSKRVLVVEGEKCVDAAASVLGDRAVVTTWMGGASSVSKTDWGPLAGRDVTIWPDADHSGLGQKAALQIAQIIKPAGADVKIIDVSDIKEDKWDVADAVADHWDLRKLQEWVKDHIVVYDNKTVVVNNGNNAQTAIINIAPDNKALANPGGLVGIWNQLGLQLVGGNNPNPSPNAYNIHRILMSDILNIPEIWFDTFENHLCIQGPGEEPRKMLDADVIMILRKIQGFLGIPNVKASTVWEIFTEFEVTNKRNWAADWIKGLKWDGVVRIRGFFRDYAGAEDTEYINSASENWWVSLVARIVRPGCQVDTMPILEGKQGVGKSRLLRIIGRRLHSEIAEGRFDEKEIIRGMNGKAIIEFGELHCMRKADVTQLKSFLTRTVDTCRGLYQRTHKDVPRHCVFVGTTNEDEYFIDTTGNRRFWPIATDRIEEDKADRDRDQLFAEAYHKFSEGHQWWIMPWEETEEVQDSRVKSDAMSDSVRVALENFKPTFRMSDLFQEMEIHRDQWTFNTQVRMGSILRQLGYRKVQIKVDGVPQKFWTRLAGSGRALLDDPV